MRHNKDFLAVFLYKAINLARDELSISLHVDAMISGERSLVACRQEWCLNWIAPGKEFLNGWLVETRRMPGSMDEEQGSMFLFRALGHEKSHNYSSTQRLIPSFCWCNPQIVGTKYRLHRLRVISGSAGLFLQVSSLGGLKTRAKSRRTKHDHTIRLHPARERCHSYH